MKLSDVKVGQRVKVVKVGSLAKTPHIGQPAIVDKIDKIDNLKTRPTVRLVYSAEFAKAYRSEVHSEAHPRWWVEPEEIELFNEFAAPSASKSLFPADAAERKKYPVATGVLDYFTSALAEVAKVSFIGNEQHNPGQELHWARKKSADQADTILRHFMERGKFDSDGTRHSAKLAWRALALLQLELEAEGAPLARGARIEEGK